MMLITAAVLIHFFYFIYLSFPGGPTTRNPERHKFYINQKGVYTEVSPSYKERHQLHGRIAMVSCITLVGCGLLVLVGNKISEANRSD